MIKKDSPSGDKWKQKYNELVEDGKFLEALNLAEEHFTGKLKTNAKALMQLHNIYKKQKEGEISKLKVIKQNELNKVFGTGYTQGVEEKEAKFRKVLEELKEWNCYCKTCGKHGPAATKLCFKKNHLILIPWNDIEEHFAEILNKGKEVSK